MTEAKYSSRARCMQVEPKTQPQPAWECWMYLDEHIVQSVSVCLNFEYASCVCVCLKFEYARVDTESSQCMFSHTCISMHDVMHVVMH